MVSRIKVSHVVAVLILLVGIGVIAFYAWPRASQAPTSNEPDYFTLTFVDKNISQSDQEKYTQRFEQAKSMIQQNANILDPWLELGIVKKLAGDYRGAEAVWLKANELRPKNSTSFGNLADLSSNFLNQYDKAEQSYLTAIANSTGETINISYSRSYYDFALNYLKDGAKAEQILLAAIERNPKSVELHILLGQFYRDSGDKAKALTYFKKALALDPTDELVQQEIQKLK